LLFQVFFSGFFDLALLAEPDFFFFITLVMVSTPGFLPQLGQISSISDISVLQCLHLGIFPSVKTTGQFILSHFHQYITRHKYGIEI